MKKLKEPSLAALLRNYTTYVAKTKCPTRLSATFEMVEVFVNVEEFLDSDKFEEKEDYLLRTRDKKKR